MAITEQTALAARFYSSFCFPHNNQQKRVGMVSTYKCIKNIL